MLHASAMSALGLALQLLLLAAAFVAVVEMLPHFALPSLGHTAALALGFAIPKLIAQKTLLAWLGPLDLGPSAALLFVINLLLLALIIELSSRMQVTARSAPLLGAALLTLLDALLGIILGLAVVVRVL